jgi:DNA-binding transcriptional ArsR family regulator
MRNPSLVDFAPERRVRVDEARIPASVLGTPAFPARGAGGREIRHAGRLTGPVDASKNLNISTGLDAGMHRKYLRAIPREWRDVAKVFVALGDEHRQRILLLFEKGERLNVGQIAAVSTLSRPAVSHHLKILREAGVLASEKLGKEVWFWIDRPTLESALANVLDYVRESS